MTNSSEAPAHISDGEDFFSPEALLDERDLVNSQENERAGTADEDAVGPLVLDIAGDVQVLPELLDFEASEPEGIELDADTGIEEGADSASDSDEEGFGEARFDEELEIPEDTLEEDGEEGILLGDIALESPGPLDSSEDDAEEALDSFADLFRDIKPQLDH